MNSNKSTAQLVSEEILSNPFLINYLKKDLINYTSLARELFDKIKSQNKKATLESISIAIKRLDLSKYNIITNNLKNTINQTQILLRDEVSLFCLNKSSQIPSFSQFGDDDIFFINQGANEITLIIDSKNSNLITSTPKYSLKNLSLISLKSNYRDTTGFVYVFLSQISTSGINIVDMISTHSQFTIIVNQIDAMKVFEICQKLKKSFN